MKLTDPIPSTVGLVALAAAVVALSVSLGGSSGARGTPTSVLPSEPYSGAGDVVITQCDIRQAVTVHLLITNHDDTAHTYGVEVYGHPGNPSYIQTTVAADSVKPEEILIANTGDSGCSLGNVTVS